MVSNTRSIPAAVLFLSYCQGWLPAASIWSVRRLGERKTSRILFSPKAVSQNQRDDAVQEVLQLARELGPVGSFRSSEEQARIKECAVTLKSLSDDKPARIPLVGTHHLVYSAAPGGSSGRLFGPVYGKVTQEFVNEETFRNIVQLGPVKIALTASRQIENDTVLTVKFLKTEVQVFGNTVVERDIVGGGTWNYIFAGVVEDANGNQKLVRVMETPSLFVIEQNMSS